MGSEKIFKMGTKSIVATVCLTFFLVCSQTANAEFIDDGDNLAVDKLFESFCRKPGARVAQKTTILNLEQHLASLVLQPERQTEPWIVDCVARYKRALPLMSEIIKIGGVDGGFRGVCSHEHISTISDYHFRFVLGSLPTRWSSWTTSSRKSDEQVEVLRDFFVRYAVQVAQACNEHMLPNLEAASKDANVDLNSFMAQSVQARLLVSLQSLLYSGSAIKKRGNFMLFWNAIVDTMKRKGKISKDDYINESGDASLVMIKLKQTEELTAKQEICRQMMRPVYQDTVLPVMRLIDLGYLDQKSIESSDMTDQLRDWYAITQLCEFLLPISFYGDQKLAPKTAVILKTQEETEGLEGPPEFRSRREIGSNSAVQPIQLDNQVPAEEGPAKLMKRVKVAGESRNKMSKTMLKAVAKNTKMLIKKGIGRIFMRKRSGNGKFVDEKVGEKELVMTEKLVDGVDDLSAGQPRGKREIYYDELNEQSPNYSYTRSSIGGFLSGIYTLLKIVVAILAIVLLSGLIAAHAG